MRYGESGFRGISAAKLFREGRLVAIIRLRATTAQQSARVCACVHVRVCVCVRVCACVRVNPYLELTRGGVEAGQPYLGLTREGGWDESTPTWG